MKNDIFRYVNDGATIRVGSDGEEMAVRYLRSLGYDVRGRNLKLGRDEIDILAFDPVDGVLVFAEVKSRAKSSDDFRPDLNLDARKKIALRRAARKWVAQHAYEGGYRLDLVCIAAGQVVDHWKELSWE